MSPTSPRAPPPKPRPAPLPLELNYLSSSAGPSPLLDSPKLHSPGDPPQDRGASSGLPRKLGRSGETFFFLRSGGGGMTDSWGSYRSWDLGSTQPSKVEGRLFVFDLEIGSVSTP